MTDKNIPSILSNDAVRLLKQARASRKWNLLEKALEECDAAIRIDPALAGAHKLRGTILERLHRTKEAKQAYREAARWDPDCSEQAKQSVEEIDTKVRLWSLRVQGKGFGIRAGAYVIDLVIMRLLSYLTGAVAGVLAGIVMVAVSIMMGRELYLDEQSMRICGFFGGLILSVAYFGIFEWLFGATLGKLVLGMRVVRESGKGCDLRASLVRALYRFIDGFFFAIPASSSMEPPFQQRIGDKKARTLVVGSTASVILEPRAWWWFAVALGIYLMLATVLTVLVLGLSLR